MSPTGNKETERTPPIKIRVSERALRELDKAADRAGRSRNAEAAFRMERALVGETPYPEERALLDLVTLATVRAGALIGPLGQDMRSDGLAIVKSALAALLERLGAADDGNAAKIGASVAQRLLDDAQRAVREPASTRTPTEAMLADAIEAWGLSPERGNDG